MATEATREQVAMACGKPPRHRAQPSWKPVSPGRYGRATYNCNTIGMWLLRLQRWHFGGSTSKRLATCLIQARRSGSTMHWRSIETTCWLG